MNQSAAKKDVQKLQRTVVDALENVKAQAVVVFDTEHLSSLFERVVVASGTSNRQTKALAASVRDKVRAAGFDKPRIEGEDNGEWIIVDCNAVVVHIMQPTIRSYYNLEEIWGEKPVRLKLGAPKPAKVSEPESVSVKKPSRKTTTAKKATRDAPHTLPAKSVASKRSGAKSVTTPSAKKPVVKTANKLPIVKVALKGAKSSAKTAARAATSAAGKATSKPVAKSTAKPATKRPAAKNPASRKA